LDSKNLALLIVTSHRVSDTFGGVEKFVESYSKWCCERGIKTTVVSRSLSINPVKVSCGAKVKVPAEGNIAVKKIKMHFFFYYLGLASFSFLAFLYLLNLIKKLRLTCEKSIVIHSQAINFAALATVSAGRLTKTPTIIHQHGPYQNLIPSKLVKVIEQSINQVTCKLAGIIITTDDSSAQYIQRIASQNSNKLNVIPAGIDIKSFNVSKVKPKGPADCFKIGYVGRLSPEKNLDTLLLGFKSFIVSTGANCKLMLVGDGELRDSLKDLAIKLGINSFVEFTGFQKNVKAYLTLFDVFILPSKIEGTPISLMEAMSAGKAIITSGIPSIRQIIDDKKDGLLFDPNAARQLTDLITILYNNPSYRLYLGENAKEKSKQYDFSVVFSKILKCYYSVLSRMN
jgi:glycosyltransferase involved in cell wall biosynthesis